MSAVARSVLRHDDELADHSKWGVVGLTTVVDLRDVERLVVDDGLDAAARATLADQVGELVVVPED